MFKSLRMRLVLLFFSLLLLMTLALSYTIYNASEKLILDSLGQQAKTIAASAVKLVDQEQYAKLQPDQGETIYYKELREKLNSLRETNNLKYLYTMGLREENGRQVYYYMVDGAPADASGDDYSPLGKEEEEVDEELIATFETQESQLTELTIQDPYGATISAYLPILDKDGKLLGVMGSDFDANAVYGMLQDTKTRIQWMTALALLVGLALVYGVARYITVPLRRIAQQAERVRRGDLSQQEAAVRSRDELGQLAESFAQMTEDLRAMIAGVKDGTLVLNESTQVLTDNMLAAGRLGQELEEHLEQAAAGAEQERSTAAETSRAMEEVGTGVYRIAENTSSAAGAALEANQLAVDGTYAVQETVTQMERIHGSAQQVSATILRLAEKSGEMRQIVDAMKEIANQTNLLALNAAIEAARAGEHGRGFAVVAEQVRKLAAQSEASAGEIGRMIEEMNGETKQVVEASHEESAEVAKGLDAVRRTGGMFDRIRLEVEQVARQIQEVSATSEEMSAAAEEVTASVDEIARKSQMAADRTRVLQSASGEQRASSLAAQASLDSLRAKALELEGLVQRFKL